MFNKLYDYAVCCNYSSHGCLKVEDGNLVDTNDKTESLDSVLDFCVEKEKTADESAKQTMAVSLMFIQENLKKKCESRVAKIFYPERVKKIQGHIQVIDTILSKYDSSLLRNCNGEEVFRLKFLASLPDRIHPMLNACPRWNVAAPSGQAHSVYYWRDGTKDESVVDENRAIAWLSTAVYGSVADLSDHHPKLQWEEYSELMLKAYKGSHFLIEDDRDYSQTEQLKACGAIIRGSSHYEKGRKIEGWNEVTGEPIYATELHRDLVDAEIHHYGLTGRHIRHILFNPVEMLEIDRELVYGKTARQVEHLLKAKGEEVDPSRMRKRHYVAFQTESSPDSEGNNMKDPLFWTHRLVGFLTYRFLKKVGVEDANVGAYGLGRTDLKPIVLAETVGVPSIPSNRMTVREFVSL